MLKKFLKIILLIIFALTLELGYFNLNYFISYLNKNQNNNIRYSLNDVTFNNWERLNEKEYISYTDSNIIIENLDTYVDEVYIEYNVNTQIPVIDVFYTIDNNQYFTADNMITINNPNDKLTMNINKYVASLRVDLSDLEGLIIDEFTIIINPIELKFNIYRVIAMIMIYVSFKSLFLLQKNPKYDI